MSAQSMSPGTPKPETVAAIGHAWELSSTRWPLPAKPTVLEPTEPPVFTSSVPPLKVVTPATAPPENTVAEPPEETTPLETVPPEMTSSPFDPTLVLLAVPPEYTTCWAAPDTKVPVAMPVLLTYSMPPA